jgi:glycosyltransferase involved in cell wall biosynthesis
MSDGARRSTELKVHNRNIHVDVVMPTWNSNGWYFPMVIKSVIDTLNPNHLVVIDRFSGDGTQETLIRYAGSILKIFELDIDLAIARRIGGSIADTEIVCYVDDDVIIPPRFKTIISRLMEWLTKNDKVGVIAFAPCSKELIASSAHVRVSRIIKSLLHLSPMQMLKKGIHIYSRGFTFFFCVKRKLIEIWNPPPDLSAYEDYHLSQHILNNGYLWVEFSLPCVIHMKDYRFKGLYRYLKQGLWEGANAIRAGIPLSYIMLHVLGRFVGSLYKKELSQFITYIGYSIGLTLSKKFKTWVR